MQPKTMSETFADVRSALRLLWLVWVGIHVCLHVQYLHYLPCKSNLWCVNNENEECREVQGNVVK